MQTLEAWIESGYQPLVPIGDPGIGLPESAELSFTQRQRAWWLRVYQNDAGDPQCAFTRYSEEKGWYRCETIGASNLEVHHIQPTAWTEAQEPWQDPNDTLGITLCRFHHQRTIHPDIGEALDNYGEDKDGIRKTVEGHRDLADRGEVFWRNDFDDTLTETAEAARQHYMIEHPLDPYPDDPKWTKTVHPKKKGWWQ